MSVSFRVWEGHRGAAEGFKFGVFAFGYTGLRKEALVGAPRSARRCPGGLQRGDAGCALPTWGASLLCFHMRLLHGSRGVYTPTRFLSSPHKLAWASSVKLPCPACSKELKLLEWE